MNPLLYPIDEADLIDYIFYWQKDGIKHYQFADHNEVFYSIVSLCRFLKDELDVDVCSINYLKLEFARNEHEHEEFIKKISGGYQYGYFN